MTKPFFDDGGRCVVEKEERSELMPSEATSEGGEDGKDGNCSWNGLDCAEAAVIGRLGWLIYCGAVSPASLGDEMTGVVVRFQAKVA